jgi:hypothetical protein
MNRTLPIPTSALHYADPAQNDEAQSGAIRPLVDLVHYPTLGCPALRVAGQTLTVLVSLPDGVSPDGAVVSAVDRHGGAGSFPLPWSGPPTDLGLGPIGKTGRRRLFALDVDLGALAPALYDVHVSAAGRGETQPNALRVYETVTGDETVLFCGDSQFHLANAHCLERFVERVNRLDDVAWVALIGDVCDNDVRGTVPMLRLSAGMKPGPVTSHYTEEFARSHAILSRLRKPIFLLVGNHDGMAAYEDYLPGAKTDVVLGKDPLNLVVYDGLHHFRRTFGPLHYAFDWAGTRYLAANSFELPRAARLGYHAVVMNWGGWMTTPQLDWLAAELCDADRAGQEKVLFLHHDPRGGSLGKDLGHYATLRDYEIPSPTGLALDYLRYLVAARGRRRWQQEWMREPLVPMDDHPARRLLGLLTKHHVSAVFMGHDNENWVESYQPGDDLFTCDPAVVHYAGRSRALAPDPARVAEVEDLLTEGDFEGVLTRVEGLTAKEADRTVEEAIDRLEAQGSLRAPAAYAPGEVKAWNIRAEAPIHFVHVDDVGAYEHDDEDDFEAYGYVRVWLSGGLPARMQRFDLSRERPGREVVLGEE